MPVKAEDQQAVLLTHGTGDFFVRQQTQLCNAIRAHLGEFGVVAPKCVHNVAHLLTLAEDAVLPEAARQAVQLLADQFRDTRQLTTRSPPPSGSRRRRTRSPNACKPSPASARSPPWRWR